MMEALASLKSFASVSILLFLGCSWFSLGVAQGRRCLPFNANLSKDKKALVVAPIGDFSFHNSWLRTVDGECRNWDLFAMYYGSHPESFSCPDCLGIQNFQGAKWRIISKFLNSTTWRHDLSHRYDIVMFPDDDLQLSSTVLNKFFEVFDSFGLVLGQPSVCPYVSREPYYL